MTKLNEEEGTALDKTYDTFPREISYSYTWFSNTKFSLKVIDEGVDMSHKWLKNFVKMSFLWKCLLVKHVIT